MVARDAREQVDAEPFELVAAHTRPDRVRAGEIHVGRDLSRIEGPHREVRRLHEGLGDAAVHRQGHGGMQGVGPPGQPPDLRAGRGGVRRLVEQRVPAGEHLIGTDDDALRMARRDRAGLRLREPPGERPGASPAQAASTARSSTPGASVPTRNPAPSRRPRRVGLVEASSRGSAPRQRVAVMRPSSGSDELEAVLAVEIDDRGGRLLDGAAGDVDGRPAVLGAEPPAGGDLSVTALRST